VWEYSQAVGIFFYKDEDLYFEPHSRSDGAWGAHSPVLSYKAEIINAKSFVQTLKCALSFSRDRLSDKELDEIYGSSILPSKGKGAFTKKCHYVSCDLMNDIYHFSASQRDGRGGFSFGFDKFEVPSDASDEQIYQTYLKAMNASIELDKRPFEE